MTNVPQAGSGGTPQGGLNNTPALNALVQQAQAKPEPRFAAFKGAAFKRDDVIEALSEDLSRIDPRREADQIKVLAKTAVSSALGGKPLKRVMLKDVKAIGEKLNKLSGRVANLCEAATADIDALLRQKGPVSDREDPQGAVLKGLFLGIPNARRNLDTMKEIDRQAKKSGAPGSDDYLTAAKDAVQRKVQKRAISNAIVEAFPELPKTKDFVTLVLESLHARRLELGRTRLQDTLMAEDMFGGAIDDLEEALNNPAFRQDVEDAVMEGRGRRRNDARANRKVAPKEEAPGREKPQADGVGQLNSEVLDQLQQELKKRA